MWKIFDELIAAVSRGLRVRGCVIGLHWTLIRSKAIGMALTPFNRDQAYGPHGISVASQIGKQILGMPVHRLAEYVKSWNFYEATLGLAAINSALNSPEDAENMSGLRIEEQVQVSAFEYYADALRGKKVVAVGRFPDHAFLVANAAMILGEGKVSQTGSPDRVITDESMKNTYGINVSVIGVEKEADRKVTLSFL
jgi:uncharacterized protein (DUF4213/DUF364 family)